jgi:hypothetical protein
MLLCDDHGTLARELDSKEPFQAREVEDPQPVEGLAGDVADDLRDPT